MPAQRPPALLPTLDDLPGEMELCTQCELHGDVFPIGPPMGNCIVDIDDINCVLAAFGGQSCPGADLSPCGGNGIIDIDDILAVLHAFGGTPDCPDPCPNGNLNRLTQFLVEMALDLAPALDEADFTALVQVAEPFSVQTTPTMEAQAEAFVFDAQGQVGGGGSSLIANRVTGAVDFFLELTEGGVTRTLNQSLQEVDGVLTAWGSIAIDDGSGQITTLEGGWTYSAASGAQAHPDSEAGFDAAVASMLHISPVPRGGVPSIPAISGSIGSIISMLINYFLDLFIPYTPPNSCSGVSIFDGEGQSCDGVNIPCRDRIADMCLSIDDLPGVSTAFRQCMKGRCGCGGSTFRRLRMSCDFVGNCGACPSTIPDGCNLPGGSRMWYCNDNLNSCGCMNIVFHEMSHGCGAADLENGANLDAYRIGDWFEDQYFGQFPFECFPVREED